MSDFFIIKASKAEDIDFYVVNTLTEIFMVEVLDQYKKMIYFENTAISEAMADCFKRMES